MADLKRVDILEAEKYDKDFPPENVVAFLEWTNSIISKIPEEYWEDSHIEFIGDESYGDPCTSVEVFYYRPLTKEEIKEQRREHILCIRRYKERELIELKRLQDKYK